MLIEATARAPGLETPKVEAVSIEKKSPASDPPPQSGVCRQRAGRRAAAPAGDGVTCEPPSAIPTAAEEYGWVGTRQVWRVGTVNLATGRIHIDGYMQ